MNRTNHEIVCAVLANMPLPSNMCRFAALEQTQYAESAKDILQLIHLCNDKLRTLRDEIYIKEVK